MVSQQRQVFQQTANKPSEMNSFALGHCLGIQDRIKGAKAARG